MGRETGTKKCFRLSSKLPSVTARFPRNLHRFGAHVEAVPRVMCVPPRCNEAPYRDEELFQPQGYSAVRYCPTSIKLEVILAHGKQVPRVTFASSRFYVRGDRDEKLFRPQE
jgi:hypothetical protein